MNAKPFLHSKGLTHNAITKHKLYRSLLLLAQYYDTFGPHLDPGKKVFFNKLWEKVYNQKRPLEIEDKQKLHMLLLQLTDAHKDDNKIQQKYRKIEKNIYNYVD